MKNGELLSNRLIMIKNWRLNMKTKEKKGFLLLGLVMMFIVVMMGIIGMRVETQSAFAETIDSEQTTEFIVSTDEENIAATYEFVQLNETDCSVRITNKNEATKAIIPSVGDINGKEYKVTQVANNGFMSSPKLIRVSLPYTIKKIGSNAFANCAKLNRVNISNVEEIGNSAFMRCPELNEIVIPKSVTQLGTYVFRNNNTQIRVRAEAAGENWASSWNSNNTNQQVEYSSSYVQPLELEPIYDVVSRSSDAILAYTLAGGQPRTEGFYIDEDNRNDYTDNIGNNIFIPAQYNGKDILGINAFAFEGVNFEQLIVEYSERELFVDSFAFSFAQGSKIIINRSIDIFHEEDQLFSESVFLGAEFLESIVLPKTLNCIPPSMFCDCSKLSNIFFIVPADIERQEALKIIEDFEKDDAYEKGVVYLPNGSAISSIEGNAFQRTTAINQLHLDDTIQSVGETVLADWDNDKQTVYIHNQRKITGWHSQWNSTFSNIVYDNYFYTITFNPNGGVFVDSDATSAEMEVKLNHEIGDLPEVTKPQNDFLGWYSEDGDLFTSSTIYRESKDIELKAGWREKTYKITFNKQKGEGGTDFINVKWGQLLPPVDAPVRTGYTFKGYYSKPNGQGERFYYEDMGSSYIWESEENITIFAYWEVQRDYPFKITYDLDGGKNNGGNPETYTVAESLELKDAVHDTLYFDGWLYNGKKIKNLDGIDGDIILKATWTDIKTIHITSAFTNLNITEPKVAIIFGVYFSSNCTITIGSSSNIVGISGSGNTYNMNINITSRLTDFSLVLYNIGIKAHSNSNAIKMDSTATLNLFTYYSVFIQGCTASSDVMFPALNMPLHGIDAIDCGSIAIQHADGLIIKGGDGANGIDNPLGTGVNGGNGGAGIKVKSNAYILCSNVMISGGLAGNGGNGIYKGYGGVGGYAIIGRSTSFAYVLNGVQNVYFIDRADGLDGTGKEPSSGGDGSGGGIIMPTDPTIKLPPIDLIIDPGVGGGGGIIIPEPPIIINPIV